MDAQAKRPSGTRAQTKLNSNATVSYGGRGYNPETLHQRFSDLLARHLPTFPPRNGRGMVLCIFHSEKTPSLSIDLEKGVFHCFGCGVGGGVKKFAELVGEPWAVPSHHATLHSLALEKARQAYHDWQRCQLVELTDEYRDLDAEIDIAAIAFRALHRAPHLYTEDEHQYWVRRLATLYNRRPGLAHDLDVLTFEKYQDERCAWWREEADRG